MQIDFLIKIFFIFLGSIYFETMHALCPPNNANYQFIAIATSNPENGMLEFKPSTPAIPSHAKATTSSAPKVPAPPGLLDKLKFEVTYWITDTPAFDETKGASGKSAQGIDFRLYSTRKKGHIATTDFETTQEVIFSEYIICTPVRKFFAYEPVEIRFTFLKNKVSFSLAVGLVSHNANTAAEYINDTESINASTSGIPLSPRSPKLRFIEEKYYRMRLKPKPSWPCNDDNGDPCNSSRDLNGQIKEIGNCNACGIAKLFNMTSNQVERIADLDFNQHGSRPILVLSNLLKKQPIHLYASFDQREDFDQWIVKQNQSSKSEYILDFYKQVRGHVVYAANLKQLKSINHTKPENPDWLQQYIEKDVSEFNIYKFINKIPQKTDSEQNSLYMKKQLFFNAIENDLTAEVAIYLKNDHKLIDTVDVEGNGPLHIASIAGHTEIVKLLLENGARSDKSNTEGATALFLAVQEGHVDLFKLLIAHGAENHIVLNTNQATPLMVASALGYTNIVKLLLEKLTPEQISFTSQKPDLTFSKVTKYDINKYGTNVNALMLAVINRHINITNILLKTEAGESLLKANTSNGYGILWNSNCTYRFDKVVILRRK